MPEVVLRGKVETQTQAAGPESVFLTSILYCRSALLLLTENTCDFAASVDPIFTRLQVLLVATL